MTLSNGIPIKNVYYMLSYAFNQLQRNNYERIASEEFEHIYDLYAEILTRGIAHVLKRGLHKEYVSRTESLSTLKGQIDIMGTIRARMMQSGKLVCNHDELSIDNLYNQILLTTARLLLKQPDVAQQRKAELRRELLFFKGVNEVNLKNVRWSNLTYNQNSKPYQMLHGICHFITKGLLHTTEKGVHYLPHFSEDDMSELFEHFVLEYYKTHYPEYKAEARGIEWNLRDVSGYKHLIPKMKNDI